MAAVRACELGLRAIVLERGTGGAYPCNSRYSGGIVHLAFHDPHRPPEELASVIKRVTEGDADTKLALALAQSGRQMIDWLQQHGVRFMRFNPQEGYRWCMAPPRSLRAGMDWKGRGPDVVLHLLEERLHRLGGTLKRGAEVVSLRMQDGRCVGAVSKGADGMTEWTAACVLLADGGFQADRDLYQRYIGPHFDRVFQRGARTGTGAGLRMALEAGAALTGTDRFYGHLLCRDALHNDNVWPYPELDAIATAGIVVDGNGIRVADEGRGGVFLTNALAAYAYDGPLFTIFDAAIWEQPGRTARIPANPLLEEAGGTVVRAESITELAEKIGVPASELEQTVSAYNAALAAGRLGELPIPRSSAVKPWPIVQAPFMAIPVCPGITYTMGGIVIDERSQVLRESGEPIPGLLAAGATTGGLEGGRNAAYLGGLLKAGTFGLIAAERAAELVAATGSSREALRQSPGPVAAPLPPPATPPAGSLSGFPALKLISRYGVPGSLGLGVIVAILVVWLGWTFFGGLAIPVAAIAGGLAALIGVSYTELIRLITEFLMPASEP
jgi:fumarate reductase flavoprotein subunit